MNTRTVAEYTSIWSDLHKDAYGFRPREDVSGWTAQDFEKEFARLEAVIADSFDSEAAATRAAIDLFEAEVASIQAAGVAGRDTAVREIFKLYDLDYDHSFDREHFEYKRGLEFGYLAKAA